MAQADAARAHADLSLAQKQLRRQQELYEAGVVARKDLEQSQADVSRAEAEFARANSRVRLYSSVTGVDQNLALASGIHGVVVERNINVKSQCEHHLVPIIGQAHVAYIPKDRVLGLSKIPRAVEFFARRPQIQERLTEQVFYALEYILGTSDIAVCITANHICVSMRGVEDTSEIGRAHV